MYETIEQIEAGIAAYRKMKRRRLNRRASVGSGGGDIDDAHNLAKDVPNDAWEMWQEMPPDPRDEFDDDRIVRAWQSSDDLGTIIKDAVADGKIVDLGSGTYEMDETVGIGGDLFAVVGDGSENATIRWNGPRSENADEYPDPTPPNPRRHGPGLLFTTGGGSLAKGFLYGVTVDIEGETEPGLNRDAAIMRAEITDELWVDDVVLSGERHRYQRVDGSLGAVSYASTLQLGAIESDATIFLNNVTLTDGQRYVDVGRKDHFGQGSAISGTNPHRGTAVFKDVRVHDWSSVAFYLANRPGRKDSRNVLWNCEVVNCSAGHVRIGFNDTIVGGRIARDDSAPDLPGTPLRVQEGSDVEVIGLEIESSNHNRAIALLNAASDVTFDRLVLRVSGSSQHVYCRPNYDPNKYETEGAYSIETDLDVTLRDCYLYEDSGSGNGVVFIDNGNENHQTVVEAVADTRIKSEAGAEINTRSQYDSTPRGWFEFEGEVAEPGKTFTSDELGMADLNPEDLPSYGFDYSVRE